ncbi:MAG: alpha/beta fold hydrolase [bacterium]|nr:alpha/beta fold hydrolase [bacterium]
MKWTERMVTVARRDEPQAGLEAIYVAAGSDAPRGAVVAPPHPLYGGSMESPVVNELAYACFKQGLTSVRFNWRGVGASSGQASGGAEDADEDYASALDHMAETVPGKLIACGYSFGAAAAVRVAARHPRVDRMILVAPPPSLISPDAIAETGKRVLAIVGALDDLAPAAALEAAFSTVPRVELVVLPGADHFFASGLTELARCVTDWL